MTSLNRDGDQWKEIQKKCWRCKNIKSLTEFHLQQNHIDGHSSYCKSCKRILDKERIKKLGETRNAQFKEYYQKNKDIYFKNSKKYGERYPEKKIAHRLVSVAIKKGLLKREPCFFCGEVKTDAHHQDYTEPTEVIWLCRQCHLRLHSINTSELEKVRQETIREIRKYAGQNIDWSRRENRAFGDWLDLLIKH